MIKRRGISMVETLLAVALTAVILGMLTGMFVYTTQRIGSIAAESLVLQQTMDLMDELEETVAVSRKCEVVSVAGRSALKCTMPASGEDTDGDGLIEAAVAVGKSRRGLLKYDTGNRVWMYFSDSSGDISKSGKLLWRCVRSDDAVPLVTDQQRNFTYYEGTAQYRWSMVESVMLNLDAKSEAVVVTVSAKAFASDSFDDKNMTTASSRNSETITLSRSVMWENRW